MQWICSLADSDDVVLRILDGKLVSYVEGNDNLHGGIQGDPWQVTENYEGQSYIVENTIVPEVVIEENTESPAVVETI